MTNLETRAQQNAKTIQGWNAEKQAAYEAFMQAEKEAEKAATDRHKTEREALDIAIDASVPEAEAPPPDPWEEILAKVETMPSVPGALARTKSHINVTSAFLLEKVLGLSRDSGHKTKQDNAARLAIVMCTLGWEKPANVWMGNAAFKGYRKERYD
jgi:hypothetical protein